MKRTQVSVHFDQDMIEWLETEATRDRRSRSGQIEYFLAEMRRIREHNQKAIQRGG